MLGPANSRAQKLLITSFEQRKVAFEKLQSLVGRDKADAVGFIQRSSYYRVHYRYQAAYLQARMEFTFAASQISRPFIILDADR